MIEDSRMICDECNREFSTELKLKFHKILWHKKVPIVNIPPDATGEEIDLVIESISKQHCLADYSFLCSVGKELYDIAKAALFDTETTGSEWQKADHNLMHHVMECSKGG